LSAYLDGSQFAVEQAEIERLLAASPAARQLLDDLRALSTALQSLPQQKLGEDLSRQVLRVAERRMLTEGEPDDTAPVPLSRTGFRRFVNRRTLVWTGLAVAIAVLIAVNEHRQQGILADKELATARTLHERASEQPGGEPRRPATIQAAPGAIADSAKAERKLATEKKPGRAPAESERFANAPTAKKALEVHIRKGNDNFGAAPSVQAERLDAFAAPAKAGPPATTPSLPPQDRLDTIAKTLDKVGTLNEKTGQADWYQADGSASIGPDVLVVFCDISPEAAKKKAFDKVLAHNGIVSRRHSAAKDNELADGRESAHRAKAAVEETLKRELTADGVLRRRVVAGNAELLYVEATPAQVKATLVGLAAQPKAFVSVSVRSAQDESTRQVVRYYTGRGWDTQGKSAGGFGYWNDENRRENEQQMPALAAAKPAAPAAAKRAESKAAKKSDEAMLGHDEKAGASAGADRDKSGKAASGDGQNVNAAHALSDAPSVARGGPPPAAAPGSAPSSKRGSQTQAGTVAQQAAPSESAAGSGQGAQTQQKARGQAAPSQSSAQSEPRQRVLFVLRVGGGPLPVASEAGGESGDEASKSSSPPSANPSPSK